MLTAISVRHLKPGDKFIWSDDPQHDPATLDDRDTKAPKAVDDFFASLGL